MGLTGFFALKIKTSCAEQVLFGDYVEYAGCQFEYIKRLIFIICKRGESMSNTKRIEWIDFARMLAFFGAVLCHATEGIYKLNIKYMGTVSLQSKVFAFSAFTIGRPGVALFLMITGYLLLDRECDFETIKKFWKNNWLRLLICTWISVW
jgi:peptidoglycan/LPS O-acetylase OafA/YrhL